MKSNNIESIYNKYYHDIKFERIQLFKFISENYRP
jgi:hypothetical protein